MRTLLCPKFDANLLTSSFQAIATKPDIYVPVQEELRLLPWNLPGFIGIGINHLRLNGLSHYRGRHFVVNITVIKPSTKNDYWF